MALLHIIRDKFKDLDVLCYREPWFPEKLVFTNSVIALWKLTAWDYPPATIGLRKGNGRLDVINNYLIGQRTMALARGTERPVENQPWLCGVRTFLSRPTAVSIRFPWDLIFHGHKSCDVDPCSGAIPLDRSIVKVENGADAAYPLRYWSDEDVFEYLEENDVPIDPSRYAKIEGEWQILDDKTNNPDYYHTCLKCCDPEQPEKVVCPLTNQMIPNIHEHLPWVQFDLPYCGLKDVL